VKSLIRFMTNLRVGYILIKYALNHRLLSVNAVFQYLMLYIAIYDSMQFISIYSQPPIMVMNLISNPLDLIPFVMFYRLWH